MWPKTDDSPGGGGASPVVDAESTALRGSGPFSRAPMTVSEISALRGVIGYAPPSPANDWLMLRLADGMWIRVARADDDVEFYVIEPADDLARRRGAVPVFLALWAAYKHIARLGLAALERVAGDAMSMTCPIAGMDVIEVVPHDRSLPAMRLLNQLAAVGASDPQRGGMSVVGTLLAEEGALE